VGGVRDAQRLESWLRGEKPLKVLMGLEPGAATTTVDFVGELCGSLAYASQAIQIVAPVNPAPRAGQPVDDDAAGDDVTAQESTALKVIARAGSPAVDRELAELAKTEDVDLIVLGSHQRSRWARYLHGSVSRGVLYQAGTNVVCVPLSPEAERAQSV